MPLIRQWIKLFIFFFITLFFVNTAQASHYTSTWGTAPWTWTEGDRNNTISIAPGLTAAFDISTQASGSWTAYGVTTSYIDSLDGPAHYFGGIPDLGIIFDPDADQGLSRVTITLVFNTPIYDATFIISDIDSSGTNRDDRITVTTDAGDPTLSIVTAGTPLVQVSGNVAQTVDNGGASDDDTASVLVDIPDGATSITIFYDEISGNVDSAGRGIGVFGEMDFSDGGRISGHLYNDLDGNGTQDAGEPNLAGVNVVVTDSDGAVHTVTTDANGEYSADQLAPGNATVDIDDNTLPNGAVQIEGGDPTTILVVADTNTFEENNGFNIPGGTLTGHLYNDLNNNGVQDGADTDISNVEVTVTDSAGNSQTVSTDANGNYAIFGLLGGEATVTINVTDPDFPIGANQTEGTNPTIVNIVSGTTNTEENNGFYQIPPPAGQGETCYGLSDGSDELVLYDADSATSGIIGSNGVNDIETMAFNNDDSVLYAFNRVGNDVFLGTIDQDTGAFTQVSGNDVDADGRARGDGGNRRIRDIDAMGFDPVTGALYAAVLNERVGNNELLIQVNPSTGLLVRGAFGGDDYIIIDTEGAGVPNDIDDLAIDNDGTLYAIANNGGGNDRLVIINKSTGSVSDVGRFNDGANNISDLEGLDIMHDGRLIASSGTTNVMWEVNKATAVSSQFGVFDVGSDYEGIACKYKTGDISGHLYNDLDRNGVQDPGEPDLINVNIVVTDKFGNTTTVQTDANGNYLAQDIYVGNALVNIDENDPDFPAGSFQTEGGDPTTVTVVAETNTFEENNGFNIPATLTGHLYADTNGNGTQDPGEENLEDISITVTDSNGFIHTAVTDANGNYTVGNLGAGATIVDIDENDPDFPTGTTQTEGDNPTTVIVAAGNNFEENNGYFIPAQINGHLYTDTNGNGTQDAGEPNLANVDVLVTDVNGATQTVTTDANGNYTATVPPGTTTTDIDENDPDYPAGSTQTEGTDPTTTTAVAGANTFTENDGYYVPAQINGHLYTDTNGNGTQDAGEPNLANVDILVTDSNGATQTVTTDVNGNYTATVPPGATTTNVDENDPDYPAGASQTEGSGPTTTTAVAGANTFTENDGYYVPAQINGHLYTDTNGNGTQDAGEPNLANVDVLVTDVNGATQTVTTDANGNYTATVPPGTTTTDIDENDPDYPAGSTQTEGTDPTTTTAVAGANTFTENDGYYVPAQINGHLYTDTNGNGTQDAGEPNLANVDILITDSNGATQTVTTDANGNYTATVPPGATTTNVDENDPDYPAGSTQTEGTDPTTTTAVAGANTFTENDGYYVPATLNGHLYTDTNGNGTQDAGEPNLANVDVLVTDSNGATQTVTTDANGNYTATVPPGTTTTDIDENDPDYPAGASQTEGADPTQTNAVAGANTFTENDGLYVPATLNGHLYTDTNGNGTQDAGEPNLANVDVVVTDSNGATQTVTTDANGNYTATVPPGATTTNVDENDPDYPAGASQTEGTDPTTTTAVAGANTFTENDGLYVPATLNGHLYTDTNGNGTQDAGEPNLANVDVVVTDSNGATQTVTTDANGNYTATVPPGATTTNVDENDPHYPAGASQTEGTDPTTTTAVAGTNTFTENDGYYVPATIIGHLYTDTNGNGTQDAGEPNLSNIDVLVTDVNGATQTVTTDTNGFYTATVPPGDTITNIDETDPDYPAGSILTEGTDPTTTMAVAQAEVFTENDGLFLPATINGHLYTDTNGNGAQDAGEPNLANVDVLVTDVNGATQTVTTDANGNYTATVPPGATTTDVDENDPDYPAGSTQTEGTDPATTTAVAGANTFTDNDGYYLPATINGHLYTDTNGNGTQDAGEPGLANVDVLVTDSNGATQTVTTDPIGNYTVVVPPGTTTTDVDENDPDYPAGAVQTEGTDPTTTEAVAGVNTFTDNDGYFIPAPGIRIVKSVGSIADNNGNGVTDTDDIVTYSFSITNTGNLVLNPVSVTDTKINHVTCTDTTLAIGAMTICNGTYVISPADMSAGGVENVATATGTPINPDGTNGTPVSDVSDAGTNPDGTPVPTPESIETPNPLGENPNNPGDPTDDPTTVALTPIPSVEIIKSLGSIADSNGNGVTDSGDTITYSFLVSNTGDLVLNPVSVTDTKVNPVTCAATILAVGANTSCSGTYVITPADMSAGGVENVATATGTPINLDGSNGTPVTDLSDAGTNPDGTPVPDPDTTETPSPLGENPNNPGDPTDDPTTVALTPIPSVEIIKSLGSIADSNGNGVTDSGDTITYSFLVSNTGDLVLNPVSVTDTKVNPVTCAATILAVGANTSCSGTYVITPADMSAGGVENVATATGTPINLDGSNGTPVTDLSDAGTNPDGTPVPDPDTTETPSPLGENPNNPGDPTDDPTTVALTPIPSVEIIKSLGSIADSNGNGVTDSGDTITYSFLVGNTGDLVLNPVSVTDTKVDPVTCAAATLAVGENTTCSGTYVITPADMSAGGVENVATATGTPINPDGSSGAPVTDLSDAGTNPDGTPVPDPDTTETLSPLGENPNNPADPTDDPTTVVFPPGVVAGTVYEDTNGNGIQDPDEPGIAGVDVVVTDVNGVPVTLTTDENGNYATQVPAGSATIDIDETTLPTGFTRTEGTDPTPVTVPPGGIVSDVDGYQPPANAGTVEGVVYEDTNGNGQQDPGEPGISGVTVNITDSAGNTQTLVTDENGEYSATVPPGTTSVDIDETTLPGGSTQTEGDDPTDVVVPANGVGTDVDGYQPPADAGIVTGVIYEDTNGNGVQDPGEPGLAGVEVEVTDSTGNTQTVTTDENGNYTATVPPGETTLNVVDETLPGGSTQTQGTDVSTVTVPAGGTASDIDGYAPSPDSGRVEGVVYEDTNGNGTQDPGEPGIEGVHVTVTDSEGNIHTLITDANGEYGVTVPSGDALVDIEQSDIDVTFTRTEGDDPTTVTVPPDGVANDVDGFMPGGVVAGTVYEDTNGNGIQDPDEPGIAGVDVVVTDVNGVPVTLTTDENGNYATQVPAGSATIDIDETTLPTGFTRTEGTDPTPVTVPPGGIVSDVDGYQPPANAGTVEGVVYEDTNGNGQQDPGEPGISGVTVNITDSAGNTQTLVTDENGEYSATVPPGTTSVDIDETTLPGGSTQTEGDDPTDVVVPANGVGTDVDGYQPPADAGIVTGVIYEDTNGNGVQDPGEPGLAGVEVEVTDSTGNTQTVTTDENGNYTATVPPGETTLNVVDETLPGGSTQTQGTDVSTVTVPAGGTASDIDGYAPSPDSGRVEGVVYEDTNGNGTQDPGEPGIEGVHVTVTDSEGNIHTLITDANGEYGVTVPSGDALVDIEQSDIDVTFTRTEGDDPTTVTVPPDGVANDVDGFAPPVLSIELIKSVAAVIDTNGDGRNNKGDVIHYSFTVTNTGTVALTNVTVADSIAPVLGGPIAVMAPGAIDTTTFTATHIISSDDVAAGGVENVATAAGTDPYGELVTDLSDAGTAPDGTTVSNPRVTETPSPIGTHPNSPTDPTSDPTTFIIDNTKIFPWHLFMPAIINHCQPMPDFCYMIADEDNEGSNDSPLFKYTFKTNKLELVNRLGVANVESIVISLDGQTVYATDNGIFGTIDQSKNIRDSFTPVDPGVRNAGLGRGELGRVWIQDIDGLAFDPESGILYGTNRLADGIVGGQQDLLIQLNPETGQIISDAFGTGIDYVVIDAEAIGASDIDDISIDPSGEIYAIAGTSGGAGNDHLVRIDKLMGAVTDLGALHFAHNRIQDMEGLTLFNNKTLFGTTGIEFAGQGTSNSLFKIEKTTGVTTFISHLDQDFNGYVPGDFEAIECLPICK